MLCSDSLRVPLRGRTARPMVGGAVLFSTGRKCPVRAKIKGLQLVRIDLRRRPSTQVERRSTYVNGPFRKCFLRAEILRVGHCRIV